MKIHVSPPRTIVAPPALKPAIPYPLNSIASTANVDVLKLDLFRRRSYRTSNSGLPFDSSDIDEAALALVELSVLVYSNLTEIGAMAARFPDSHIGVFGKLGGRQSDLWHVTPNPSSGPLFRSIAQPETLTLKSPLDRASADAVSQADASSEAILSRAISQQNRTVAANTPQTTLPPIPLNGRGEPLFTVDTDKALVRNTATFAVRNKAPHALAIMHGDAALISFRGTADFADIGIDLCVWPTFGCPSRHWGFESRWRRLRPQIERWLEGQTQRLGVRPKIYLGGHSLGGAIASLAALDLAGQYEIERVVSIGSARPGGASVRDQYRRQPAAPDPAGKQRSLSDVTTRFTHGNDAITSLPPLPFYRHVEKATPLRASDPVPIEEFGSPASSTQNPLANSHFPKHNWRFTAQQIALGTSTSLPQAWGVRILAILAPMLIEGLVRSFFRHKSARYLGYFPATEVRGSSGTDLPA